jgi:hypothetical protein
LPDTNPAALLMPPPVTGQAYQPPMQARPDQTGDQPRPLN